jgi:glutathione peroxidase
MFEKTRVSEHHASPFYRELARAAGTYPKWNFHKYLIDRNGQLVTDYMSAIDPLDEPVIGEIKNQIKKF